MRRETLILIREALQRNRQAYVLVNNRLEGNAPLTVQVGWNVIGTDSALANKEYLISHAWSADSPSTEHSEFTSSKTECALAHSCESSTELNG